VNIARQMDTSTVVLDKLIPCMDAVALLSESAARRLCVVPMGVERHTGTVTLMVGSADPGNQIVNERLNRQLDAGTGMRLVKVEASAIPDALDRCYRRGSSATEILQWCASGATAEKLEQQLPEVTIRLVESLLVEAIRQRASDVHLSPERNRVHVRLRVDGVLTSFMLLHGSWLSRLIVRLKILSSIDIAESRLPQDGQFSQWIQCAYTDYRVSTFPTVSGENLVLRVMNSRSSMGSLQSLELPYKTVEHLRKAVHKPDGLVVICGPTGSGKTTTLYALLDALDSTALNIMTLEDPVEVVVAGLRQSSVDASRAFDYSDGIRALLRQDPDVLMLGEVRDTQSCKMMLRAVMTGHRVLTTVHAGNALGAIERITELGASTACLAEHLSIVISQRLIRLKCNDCCVVVADCARCQGSGYFGRQVIMELILCSPQLSMQLAKGASIAALQQELASSGFVSLREQAQQLVDKGLTSEEEIQRVLGPATTINHNEPSYKSAGRLLEA